MAIAGSDAAGIQRLDRASLIFLVLLGVELLLVALHGLAAATQSWTLSVFFDLDAEQSIPAWFSAAQLLAVGLLLLVAGGFSDRRNWPTPGFCRLVAFGFVFLAADEACSIHERITAVGRALEWAPRFRGVHGTWVFVYMPLGLVLLALTRRNLRTVWVHHRDSALLMGGGFAMAVTGAVGVEVAGYYDLVPAEAVQVAVEEFLEMLGMTVVLIGALRFFNRTVHLSPARDNS